MTQENDPQPHSDVALMAAVHAAIKGVLAENPDADPQERAALIITTTRRVVEAARPGIRNMAPSQMAASVGHNRLAALVMAAQRDAEAAPWAPWTVADSQAWLEDCDRDLSDDELGEFTAVARRLQRMYPHAYLTEAWDAAMTQALAAILSERALAAEAQAQGVYERVQKLLDTYQVRHGADGIDSDPLIPWSEVNEAVNGATGKETGN